MVTTSPLHQLKQVGEVWQSSMCVTEQISNQIEIGCPMVGPNAPVSVVADVNGCPIGLLTIAHMPVFMATCNKTVSIKSAVRMPEYTKLDQDCYANVSSVFLLASKVTA